MAPTSPALDKYSTAEAHMVDHHIVEFGSPFDAEPLIYLVTLVVGVILILAGVGVVLNYAARGKDPRAFHPILASVLLLGGAVLSVAKLIAAPFAVGAIMEDTELYSYVVRYYFHAFGSLAWTAVAIAAIAVAIWIAHLLNRPRGAQVTA